MGVLTWMDLRTALTLSERATAYAQWGEGEYIAVEGRHEIYVATANHGNALIQDLKPLSDYPEEQRHKFETRGWRPWKPCSPLEALAHEADDAATGSSESK